MRTSGPDWDGGGVGEGEGEKGGGERRKEERIHTVAKVTGSHKGTADAGFIHIARLLPRMGEEASHILSLTHTHTHTHKLIYNVHTA